MGDTLVVSDMGKRRLLFLDGEGEQVRSVPYPSEMEDAPIAQVDARDGLVLWQPHWIGASLERNMILAEQTGQRPVTGVPDPEVSFTHPDAARVRTLGGICAFRDVPKVAVSNRWAVELLILDTALDPRYRHREGGAGFDPEPVPPQYGGGWSSGFHASSGPACADSTALWAFRRHDAEALVEGTLHVAAAGGTQEREYLIDASHELGPEHATGSWAGRSCQGAGRCRLLGVARRSHGVGRVIG